MEIIEEVTVLPGEPCCLLVTTISSRALLCGCLLVLLETAVQVWLPQIPAYGPLRGTMKGPPGRRLREGTFVGAVKGRAELSDASLEAWRGGTGGCPHFRAMGCVRASPSRPGGQTPLPALSCVATGKSPHLSEPVFTFTQWRSPCGAI